jgi:predicted RNA binding protein YcfA (HicA-like mRNA interferase family)
MNLPRDLAGRALVKVLCRDLGYRVVHQGGSHIILDTEEPSHQRIPIPDHNPIRIGT